MNITRGKISTALKIVVYGSEGVGKSTFASKFPDAVFIDTEGSTKQLDVTRFDFPTSWEMVLQEVEYVKNNASQFKTLVLDTADWAERLCIKCVCDRAQKNGVEDFGWGKGYTYVAEEFGRLINLLSEIANKGVNVVVTAHAKMNKVEQPDEMGSYDRWELKLTKQTSPLLKEWADILLFANYKTIVVSTGKDKYKGQGGQQRIMYTTHTAAWDAKNRFGLADVLPFDFQQIAHLLPKNAAVNTYPNRSDEEVPYREEVNPKQAFQPASVASTEDDPLLGFIDDCKEKGLPITVANGNKAAHPTRSDEEVPYREEVSPKQAFQPAAAVRRKNTSDSPQGSGSLPPPPLPDYVPKALADLMRSKDLTMDDLDLIIS